VGNPVLRFAPVVIANAALLRSRPFNLPVVVQNPSALETKGLTELGKGLFSFRLDLLPHLRLPIIPSRLEALILKVVGTRTKFLDLFSRCSRTVPKV
jgi:hypothetical protein